MKSYPFVFFFCISMYCFTYAQEPPTITPCGKQRVCLPDSTYDLCVVIAVDSTFALPIDSFVIEWGDNTITTVYPTANLSQDSFYHNYRLNDLYKTCIFERDFGISLLTYAKGMADPLYNGSRVWFRNPPTSSFLFEKDTICIDDLALFDNLACPSQQLEYSWDYGDNSVAGTENSHQYTEAGSYNICLTVSNPCGEDVFCRTLEVLPLPIAAATTSFGVNSIEGNIHQVCLADGGIVQLDASFSEFATRFEWYSPDENNAFHWLTRLDTIQSLIKFDSAGTYHIILKASSYCDSISTDTLIFEAIEAPILSLNMQSDTCIRFPYIPSPLIDDASYRVDNRPYNPLDSAIWLDIGTHIVEVTLDNACGRQYLADTFSIQAPEEVAIIFPPTDTLHICPDTDPIKIISNTPDAVWLVNGIEYRVDTLLFQPSEISSYTILRTKGIGPCLQSDTLYIEAQGVIVEVEDLVVCPWSNPTTLIGFPTEGVWSSSDCLGCIAGNKFIPANMNNLTSVDVVYTATNEIGCQNTAMATVTLSEPKATFSVIDSCDNSLVQVSWSESIGSDFSWELDEVPIHAPPYSNVAKGLHTLRLIATSTICSDTAFQSFEVISPPSNSGFVVDKTLICPADSVLFTPIDPFYPNLYYDWSFNRYENDSLHAYAPNGPVKFENNTDNPLSYYVRYTQSNACGEASTTASIEVLNMSTAILEMDSSWAACSPFNGLFTNRTLGNPDSCQLKIGDVIIFDQCQNIYNYTFFAKDSTTFYPIEFITYNECGFSVFQDTVEVIPPFVKAYYNIDDFDFTVCPFDTIQFIDASTPFPSHWFWDFGDDTFSTEINPKYAFTQGDTSFVVKLRVSNGCGSDEVAYQIHVLPVPELNFEVPDFHCMGQAVEGIINLSPTTHRSFLWEFGNGTVDSTHFHPSPIYFSADTTFLIRLTIEEFSSGCRNSLEKELFIKSPPKAEFSFLDSIRTLCPSSQGIAIYDGSHASSWEWQYNGKIYPGSPEQLKFSFESPGAQSITLIVNDQACRDKLTKQIWVQDCKYFIPNSFSPNGDQINDYFTVFGSGIELIANLMIFDRWGNQVFNKSAMLPNQEIDGWDGSFDGRSLPPAVYVYMIELELIDGELLKLWGDVTLVK